MPPNLRPAYLAGHRGQDPARVFYTPDGEFASVGTIESIPAPLVAGYKPELPGDRLVAVFFCDTVDFTNRKLEIDKSIIKMNSYPTASLPL